MRPPFAAAGTGWPRTTSSAKTASVSSDFRAVLALAACLLTGCAGDPYTQTQSPPRALASLPGNAEIAAQSILRHTLAYHSAVYAIYQRVQGELEANPYALIDELNREIEAGRHVVGGDLDSVAEELLDHMQGARDEVKLVAEIYHLIHRYMDLVKDPRGKEVDPDMYYGYTWDSIGPGSALRTILESPFPEHRESVYYFAPSYSFVESTRLVIDTMTGSKAASQRADIAEVVETNQYVLGDTGALDEYVASHYAGEASVREKNDADPVIYSLRRMLAEQQAALE